MAVKPSVVGVGSLDQAAGDNPALRAILQQLATAANTQATKTNTSGKTPPSQSTAAVSFQNPFYIVTIVDPGGQTTLSLNQAAQQAAGSSISANSTLSNIFHQVQAATSILFDAPANLKTYGGDQGNLQNQFVIGDLDISKSWYFRFRTSYDGQTWNQWKTINPKATSVNPNAVSLVPVNGGQWAEVTLPGGQGIGFGIGQLPSGSMIQTAGGALLSSLLAIAAPATFIGEPEAAYGTNEDSIDPSGIIHLKYLGRTGITWTGSSNFLTLGWDPSGAQHVTKQTLADGGIWIVVTLSGGARIAFGVGTASDGQTIDFPTGFLPANAMGVVTPLVISSTSIGFAKGVKQATIDNTGLITCEWQCDSANPSTANWLVMAWEPALTPNLVTVTGGRYLKLPTPSGAVMIGVGQTANAGVLPLPAGYSYQKCLAFSTAGTFIDPGTGQHCHGVLQCGIDAGLADSVGTVTCLYSDGGTPWTGAANWFAIAWP